MAVPIVVAPDFTVKVTLPALAVPVPELTVAARVAVRSPYVAVAGVTLVLVPREVTVMDIVAGEEVRTAVQAPTTTTPQLSGSPRSVTVNVSESDPE